MSGYEDVFFSFTHASDPIGLAAADFMLDYLDNDFFLNISKKTKRIHTKLNQLFSRIENENFKLLASSYPGKIVFSVKNQSMMIKLKTFLQKELLSKNILFNMFLAIAEDHTDEDINNFINAMNLIVDKLNHKSFDINQETEGLLVKPVFRAQK